MIKILLLIPFLVAFGPFDSPGGLTVEGNALFEAEKYDEALAHYDRALSSAKDPAPLKYNRANALLKKGDLDGALRAYGEGIAQGTGEAKTRSLYNMGNALYGAGKFGEAAEAYKEVLKADPADNDAKVNLELTLKRMQEEEQKEPGDGKESDRKNRDEGKNQPRETGDKQEEGQKEQSDDSAADQKKEDNQEKQKGDEEKQREGANRKRGEMTREEAERLLGTLGDRNMDLQNMADMVQKADPVRVEKDW